MKIRENLKSLVVNDSEKQTTASHYIVLCPYCLRDRGKERRKLYIKKDFSIGFCFTCNNTFIDYRDGYSNPICLVKTKTKERNRYLGVSPIDITIIRKADDFSIDGIDYLKSRPDYLISEDYSKWGIKFVSGGVLLPIKTLLEDEYVYYQIRYIHPDPVKYYMPKIENKPLALIQQGTNSNIIIVEGVFGGIALARMYPEHTVIALLGKSLTSFHFWQLERYLNGEDITVFLDKTEYSVDICKSLKSNVSLNIGKLFYIESDGLDPDERLEQGIPFVPCRYSEIGNDWLRSW